MSRKKIWGTIIIIIGLTTSFNGCAAFGFFSVFENSFPYDSNWIIQKDFIYFKLLLAIVFIIGIILIVFGDNLIKDEFQYQNIIDPDEDENWKE